MTNTEALTLEQKLDSVETWLRGRSPDAWHVSQRHADVVAETRALLRVLDGPVNAVLQVTTAHAHERARLEDGINTLRTQCAALRQCVEEAEQRALDAVQQETLVRTENRRLQQRVMAVDRIANLPKWRLRMGAIADNPAGESRILEGEEVCLASEIATVLRSA